ncbi:YopX family protein [Mesobacillus zeae]|uniref:YopX protein domain-containing protein n=1 Tax=Mesobacillus zeae TaxID=1917180 RepID=A0A398B9W5_9BACI|nr:YopX family protein [Mesobacillus zeae]RID85638.1 hypothetical protein D1970_08770 [Mesobacillus zeae]
MREIKFRAWDNVKNKMYFVGESDEVVFSFDSNGINATDIMEPEYEFKTLHHLKYMQYTGLNDKNGIGIYEHDIIRFTWETDSCWGESGTYTGSIRFDTGVTEVVYISRENTRSYPDRSWEQLNESDDIKSFVRWTGLDNIEVIGNIYENKDLLEQP